MTGLKENPSIVLLGSWNPAILQPNWLAKHVFDKADDEELQIEMQFTTVPGLPPRFKIRDMLVMPAHDRLTIFAKSHHDEDLIAAENAVIRILELLPYTPIAAVGENFKFFISDEQEVVNMFNVDAGLAEYLDFDYDLVKTELRSTLQLDDRQLNLFRVRSNAEITIQFNFNYPIPDTQEIARQLGGSFINNRKIAEEILANMKVPLEED